MAVQYRSHSTPDEDSTTSFVLTAPAGVQNGDLLLLYLRALDEPIDGWELVPNTSFYGGSQHISVYYRIAGSSEPGTYTVPMTSNNIAAAAIIAFYSDTASALKIDDSAIQRNSVASTSRDWPSVTVSANNAALCLFGTIGNNATTPPVGYDERWDTFNPRAYCMTRVGVSAGAVGSVTGTGSSAQTSSCVTIAIVEGTPEDFELPQYGGSNITAYGVVTTSIACDVPDNTDVGDFLLAQLTLDTDRVVTTPDGWALVSGVTGTDNLRVYGKTADASDIGATLTITFDGDAGNAFLGILRYYSPRGRTIAADVYEATAQSSSNNMTWASLTPTATPAALVYFAHRRANALITPDALTRERWESGSALRAYAANQIWDTAGATGTRTATTGTASTAALLAVALVELNLDCKPTTRYLYGSTEITDYCYEADLTNAPRALTKRTLGDTGAKAVAGVPEYSVRLAGDWSPTIDALFGVDSRSGVQRTGEILLDDCTLVVSYKWTNAARVTEWKIVTAATGKIVWSATLRHNGAAVRSLAS